MRVSVAENRTIYIEQNYNTQNENEATIIQLQVPEKYQDYNKKIVFITDEGMVWDLFQNDEYVLTSAITKLKQVQFYIWLTKGDKDFRSQTRELVFTQNEGEPSLTPEEVDGVRTVVSLLDEEIEKVEDLESDVAQALGQLNSAIEQTNNLNLDANKQEKTTTVELTKKDGTKKTVQIDDGVSLQFIWQGTRLGIKTEDQQEYTFVDLQGMQGERGEMGEPFTVRKTYTSVAEMNADFGNMQLGDYVMIASSVDIEDNAKLYTRGENAWIFITDFSGAQGIRGETGLTPDIQIGTVASGNAPSVTRTGTAENPILNFILEKGEKGDKGNTGDTGATGNGIANIQKTSTSGLVDTYTITYTDGTTATYEVTNGEDNEYLNSVIEQAFGEVSGQGENVTLENTIEARFKKAPLPNGNTKQATRGGKNILKVSTGNATLANNYYISVNTDIIITEDMVGKPVSVSFDIILSDIVTEATRTYAGIGYGDTGYTTEFKSVNYSDFSAGKHSIKIENAIITSDMVGKKLYIRYLGFNQPSSAKYEYSNAQIEFSPIATDYEPYGAMPSPEFPSEIQNVSGDVNAMVCNKNLANLSIVSDQFRVTTQKINANTFEVMVNDGYDWGYGQIEMNLKANTQYTIFYKSNKSNEQISAWKDYNGSSLYVANIARETPAVITTTQEKIILGLYAYGENDTTKFEIMILEGQYTAQTMPDYEPHQSQELWLDLGGKNKLSLTNGTYTSNGVTASVFEGKLSLAGTAQGIAYIDIPLIQDISQNLGTVTKSLNAEGDYIGVQTSLRGADSSMAGLWSDDASNKSESLRTDAHFLRLQINSGITVNCSLYPQVEEGTTATRYSPYTENPVKLMEGSYCADDGFHHQRKQIVLDGSEIWGVDADCYYLSDSSYKMPSFGLCSHAIYKNKDNILSPTSEFVLTQSGSNYIEFTKYIFSNVEDFKSWLAEQYTNGTPVIIEYEVEEEWIQPYTEHQREQYEELKKATTYTGTTHIYSTNDLSPIFDVEALTKQDSSNFITKDVDDLTYYTKTTDMNIALGLKQNQTDNSLQTTNKTIVSAINEVNSIAKGANKAVSYSNYLAMVTAFNALGNDIYNVGQNIMIITSDVPDLWISSIESTSTTYTYTTDEAITNALATNGYIQVGYYRLSALETQKIDLTDYYQKPSGGIPKADLTSEVQASLAKADSAIQDVSNKQNITDNNLQTTNKTITSAINEVNSIATNTSQEVVNARQSTIKDKTFASVDERIEELEVDINNIETATGHVYGIRRKITNNSDSAWERLFDSVGKVATATKNGEPVQNDFDGLAPWIDIKSCNYDLTTKKIKAWIGDPDFKFDGTNGDVFTHIPKTYWKIYQENDYDYVLLADYPRTGFMKVDGFFVGRYNGSVVNDVLHTYSGLVPTTSKNRSQFRTLANALGSNFSQLDWRYLVLQMLYLVEYATYNSQSALGNGIINRKNIKTIVAENDTNRAIVRSASDYYVGQIIRIGTVDGGTEITDARKITAIEDYNSGGVTGYAFTFDGSAVNIAVNNYVCTMAQETGQCDSLGMKSGCLNNDGYHSMIYRGIENLFANVWQFVDGINIKDYVAYICKDHSQYADNIFTSPYKALAYTNADTNDYVKTLGLDVDEPFFRFPTEVGGSTSTYMADYYSQSIGDKIVLVGGAFSGGASDGLWYWNLGGSSAGANWGFGCRVLIDNQ